MGCGAQRAVESTELDLLLGMCAELPMVMRSHVGRADGLMAEGGTELRVERTLAPPMISRVERSVCVMCPMSVCRRATMPFVPIELTAINGCTANRPLIRYRRVI